MAFNISYVFQAVDKFSAVANNIKRSMDETNNRAIRVSRSIKNIGKASKDLGKKFLPMSAGLLTFGGFALRASAQMETLETSFRTMTGSAENASRLVADLRQFAAGTPFQLQGIGASTKQLLAFGVAQDDVMGVLKTLGDISAGANVPLQDMAAIFGKAKAKGKVMTEELLQLSDRGIPIIDTLANGFGVTKDQIFEMASKGQISFASLTSAMEVMSAEGGIFFDQMSQQSQTLGGIFSTLKDNIFDALVTIGDSLVDTFDLKTVLKDAIAGIQKFTTSFKAFTANNPRLTKFLFILTGVLMVLAPLLILIGAMAAGVSALAVAAGFLGVVFGFLSLPVIAVIAAVAALVAGILWLKANWLEVTDAIGGTIEQLLINFSLMVESIKGFFAELANAAVDLWENSPIGKLIDWTTSLFSEDESSAEINVNINDPGGNVESISSGTVGTGVALSVGQNMGG